MTPYFQTHFSREEFATRRERLLASLEPNSVAVLAGLGGSGAFDRFRQTNDFFYLCGVEVPHAYLLIDRRDGRTTLYLPPHDPKHERSEGAQLHSDDPEQAVRISGVDRVAAWEQLARDIANAAIIYTPRQPAEGREACRDTLRYARAQIEADPWDRRPSAEQHFCEKLSAVAPGAEFRDLSPWLDRSRLLKSPAELAVMRRAGELTAQGVIAAMRQSRAGVYEYQLAAQADCVFAMGGAQGPGYRPIVASGRNIWNAHYFRNDSLLTDGDLVLMDYAPDCGNYTSDIGRVWPVNGRFSAQQRELYDFVVRYHKTLLQVIRPGRSVEELVEEARVRLWPIWQSWEFSKPSYRAATARMIESPVAFTHPVGMAVHDVGEYRQGPLEPGLVFALDPQMWVPDEELYLRVEDTVAITATGVESFTSAAPLERPEIEALLAGAR